jgi:hypothetical protein
MSNFTIKKAAAPESTGVTPFTTQYIYDAALAPLSIADTIDICDLDIGTVVESVDVIVLTANTVNTAEVALALSVATTAIIASTATSTVGTRIASVRTTTGYAAAASETLRMTIAAAATTNLKLAIIVHGFIVPAKTKTNSLTAVA